MPSPMNAVAITRNDLMSSVEEVDVFAERQGFIGLRVMRVLDVAAQADQFGRIPVEQLLQMSDTNRASDGSYPRGEFKFVDDFYATRDRGWEEKVDEREERIYGTWFDAEVLATERAYWKVLANQEQRIAAVLYDTSVFTGAAKTTALSTEWSTHANATPINDVLAAKRKVWVASGLWPNAITINQTQFDNLKLCAQILDALRAAGAGVQATQGNITEAMLAEVLGLKHVLVAKGTKNSANAGQSFSAAEIWSSEYASVCRVAETDAVKEPCVGRTFHWTGDGSVSGGLIESYRDESKRGYIIRCRHEVHEKSIVIEAAHLLSNVTA